MNGSLNQIFSDLLNSDVPIYLLHGDETAYESLKTSQFEVYRKIYEKVNKHKWHFAAAEYPKMAKVFRNPNVKSAWLIPKWRYILGFSDKIKRLHLKDHLRYLEVCLKLIFGILYQFLKNHCDLIFSRKSISMDVKAHLFKRIIQFRELWTNTWGECLTMEYLWKMKWNTISKQVIQNRICIIHNLILYYFIFRGISISF